MTPEEKKELNDLKSTVETLNSSINQILDWVNKKSVQQISYPLDDASRNAIGIVMDIEDISAGTSDLTEDRVLSGDPQTITVPKSYIGTRIIRIDGTDYEIPYIAIP